MDVNILFFTSWRLTTFLTVQHHLCSRVVDAQSPMAIVIPTKGSTLELRDGDISWLDFQGRVEHVKYVILCLSMIFLLSG